MNLGPLNELEIKPARVFKIFSVQDEIEREYYSETLPIFLNLEEATLSKDFTVQKVSLKVDLPFDKQLEINYAEPLTEDVNISLLSGIVIKAIDKNSIEDWIHNRKAEAESQVKDEELNYYRTLLPQILKKINVTQPANKLQI